MTTQRTRSETDGAALRAPERASYLDRYDAAPEAERYPLLRKWIDQEPIPLFRELRERRPILVSSACTVVTRHEDVIDVLRMPKIFTTALYLPKMAYGIYLMAHDDDALHTREKSLMQAMLNRDDLPRVRDLVARTCRALLDAAGGSMDAIDGYCRMVPATVVQEYFGLTGAPREDLIRWSYWNQADTFYNQPFDLITDARRKEISDRHAATGEELNRFILGLIVHRLLTVKAEQAKNFLLAWWYLLRLLVRKLTGKSYPKATDDVVTRMLRTTFPGTMDFDIKRAGVNAGGLLIGAIETTSQAVAQAVDFLLRDAALLERARAAAQKDDPAELDGIVWEALRFVPISSYIFRKTARDYTFRRGIDHETTIPAGTIVLAMTQSAMFDPSAFDRPEVFDPTRDWYRYFHFGFGEHECLGRYVGMVMIPEMVRQLLRRPGLEARGPVDCEGEHLPMHYPLAWATR